MFKRTKVCSALMMAFGGSVSLWSASALAQDAAQPVQQMQRVEITGSAVRRIDAESALPVQVLKREDIERSGVTSTADLMKQLAVNQGSTGESTSTGYATFGFSGVSIHNIGETRTLVLLNGHRLAQFGGQTLTGSEAGFDLNSIPISAIERVEVLTDGASALYGADAIAGVVNFITKHDISTGDITLGFSNPKDGAREKRISATKGFGSLQDDGFNVVLSFGHDERTALQATDRSFAKSGQVYFMIDGNRYRASQSAASSIPANASDDNGNLFSPYYRANGKCPAKSFFVDDGAGDQYCGFDFVSTLQIYPDRKRDSFFGSVDKKVGDQDLFLNVLVSQTKSSSAIAPVPGGVTIAAGSALFNTYLAPYGVTQDSTAFYRVFDLGPRAEFDTAKFYDIALGSKGNLFGWDYEAGYTHSQSKVSSDISGYPGGLALSALTNSGVLNPFVGPGQQSAAATAALAAINYKGYWDGGKSDLDTLSVRASHDLVMLPAGPMQIGVGANLNREKFQSLPSLFEQAKLANPVTGVLCDPTNPNLQCDQRFGDSSAAIPYSANRRSYGVFAELDIPALKTLDFTVQGRYDHYSDFGAAYTGKGSFRWTPVPNLLFRGSIGTGFHAPTVPQINAAVQPYGVTSDKYTCTPGLQAEATAQGAVCRPGSQQYDQLAGGNKALQPEKSRQATIGLRFDPVDSLSLGVDLWHVEIRDVFGQLAEKTVFANPTAFPGAWSSNLDIATGNKYLAWLANNVNTGKYFATGLDFDVSSRAKTAIGALNTNLTLTYMIREQQQQVAGGPYYSAIGQNSDDLGTVTFRWQGRLQTSLTTGNWVNTLGMNFKSGYTDATTTVDQLDANGNVIGSEDVRLKVPTYFTFDWQTLWNFRKDMAVTLGILNIANKAPPLSISTGGLNQGQQFGYDDRYYDPRGRTLYANFSYKF